MGWQVAGSGTLEIPLAQQAAAHAALRRLAADNQLLGATRPHELLAAPNLVAYLIRAGFLVSVEDDAITGLDFCSEPLGREHLRAGSLDQAVLLEALAPFVRAGGSMDFAAEDETRWRHVFGGAGLETLALPDVPA